MNKERMLELARELEHPHKLKVKFDMSDFVETYPRPFTDTVSDDRKFDCGTSACIGGHACLMFGEDGEHIGETLARKILDLTLDQANRLFYNAEMYISDKERFELITRSEAAAAVRRMVREEGEAEGRS